MPSHTAVLPTQTPRNHAWGLAIAAALAAGATCGCERPSTAKSAPPLPVVFVTAARSMTVPMTARPNGLTRSLAEVSIRARVRGVLEAIKFTEGAEVHKGDVLFEIEKAPFEATLASAKAKLEEAQASLKRAKDSQAREIATAQVAVDQATFSLSQIEEARQRALFNRSAASRDDVDRASASRERSGAQVDADRASLDQAKVDYEINILTAQANVDAAAAAVRQAEIDLSYCTIISPIDGRVGEAKVKVGNLVGPMTSAGGADYTELTTIQQLDPMGVDIQCASRYLERATRLIKQGLDVSLVRPGAEGDQPTVYTGRCFFIDNKIDPATSTVLIKASVGNPERTLLPGEYVKLDMTVGQVPDAVVVPERAVIETQEGPTVYVVGDDDTVAVVPVTAEFVHDHMRVITKGLKPGQRVIVEGIQLVRPGQKVQAKPEPAAGNSDGQASAASLKAEH